MDRYCRTHGIEFQRFPGGAMQTRQTLPAVVEHPLTGRRCWFNQIAFLNEWTMDPSVREFLVGEFGPEGLPFTTLLGDGTPLDPATVEVINETYEKHAVPVPFRDGDLLLVDNIGTSHSRDPTAVHARSWWRWGPAAQAAGVVRAGPGAGACTHRPDRTVRRRPHRSGPKLSVR
ncbi:TauD/TfdA family dioxygenase [Streptomyces sp. M10(2022)]